jgi:hypothetical protein
VLLRQHERNDYSAVQEIQRKNENKTNDRRFGTHQGDGTNFYPFRQEQLWGMAGLYYRLVFGKIPLRGFAVTLFTTRSSQWA